MIFALLLSAILSSTDSLQPAISTRPNIVLIISDDQAWTDYGFMGHPDIRTPNLDRLAERSLVFERGYVAAPLCRPSLASILTGQYRINEGPDEAQDLAAQYPEIVEQMRGKISAWHAMLPSVRLPDK
jgi:arylsulfatase A-like enzyme